MHFIIINLYMLSFSHALNVIDFQMIRSSKETNNGLCVQADQTFRVSNIIHLCKQFRTNHH